MRRYVLLLITCGVIGSWLIYSLLPNPRDPDDQNGAEFFYQLIEPFPPATMCIDSPTEEPFTDQITYRLEVRLVTVPFGASDNPIPSINGYVSDFYQFMDMVYGDVRCTTDLFPDRTISNANTATTSLGPLTIQVKKTNDHLVLNYKQPSGVTFTQEFDLPEGAIFATNLGEKPATPIRIPTGPMFIRYVPFLNQLFTRPSLLRREEFLLLSYSEIEMKE